jgi:IS30 family transposase
MTASMTTASGAARSDDTPPLVEDWSPQQIAQRLRRDHPANAAMRVSHASIYRDLYMPSRNTFDRSMFHRLRSQRPIRQPRRKTSSHGRGRIRT